MAAHFDLIDLRLMVHVAQTNSLTRGAAASHLSVPAASTRIKNLEESFSAKLLHRTSQGVTLTAPGQALVRHARHIIGHLEDLRGDLQDYALGTKGHLRVFANTTALSDLLPPVMRDYLLSHPNISIDLRERSSNVIVRAVTDGQVDIGIVAGSARNEFLEMIPYRSDRLVLVVPTGHPMADAPSVSFAETLTLNHIGHHETSAIQALLRRVCDQLGRTLKLRIQAGNFETVCRMIEATIGVGILPESVARRHASSMSIAIVPLQDEWALRSLQICVRCLSSLPSFARDLVDMLVEDARSDARADRAQFPSSQHKTSRWRPTTHRTTMSFRAARTPVPNGAQDRELSGS